MKFILMLLLLFIFLFGLYSCAGLPKALELKAADPYEIDLKVKILQGNMNRGGETVP